MAPKTKSRLVDQPPSASSSEEQNQQHVSQEEEEQSEEEEREEEEESGEESEEEEPKTTPQVEKKSTFQKPPQTPQNPQSSSESESEDGSGSESESDQTQPSPSASDFTVKPHVPAKPPSKPPTKRPIENQQQAQKEKDSRRKKAKITEEDRAAASEEKKLTATPNRLWSDDDQIAILKGMAEFKAQKGIEPNADMAAFHDFIKGKLQVEVSKSQLTDKLRRLKKKFLTNVKNGDDPVFSRPQDYLVFELSKKIWGGGTSNGVVDENVNSTNGKAKKSAEVNKSSEPKKSAKVSTFIKQKEDEKPKEDEKQIAVKEMVKEDIVEVPQQDFQSKYPLLAASFGIAEMSLVHQRAADMLKENMSLIASDKAKVLEEKWKKLQVEEADLMLKRIDLFREHYKLVVDAMRGN